MPLAPAVLAALQPALQAFNDVTTRAPIDSNIAAYAGGDPRVELAMSMGAMLEGGGLGGGWTPGDNGTSFGPYQIHLPAHPDVTQQQAEDPLFSTRYMLPSYQTAVEQVDPALWQSDPAQAAAQADYYAEQPAKMYDPGRVSAAYTAVTGHPQITPPDTGTGGNVAGPTTSTFGFGSQAAAKAHYTPLSGFPGLVVDTATGAVGSYNPNTGQFSPIDPASLQGAGSAAAAANTSRGNLLLSAHQDTINNAVSAFKSLMDVWTASQAQTADEAKNTLGEINAGTASSDTWFPGMNPGSMAVQSGLMSPLKVSPVGFNPSMGPSILSDPTVMSHLANVQNLTSMPFTPNLPPITSGAPPGGLTGLGAPPAAPAPAPRYAPVGGGPGLAP